MVSATRKRVLILLCIFGSFCLLIRFFLLNGSLLAEEKMYRRIPGAPVVVAVYYEVLCPDSKHFIIRQLLPAYLRAPMLMEVQLVAYGKAETKTNPDGTYQFECQHGETECEANTYHACTQEVVSNMAERLEIVACMIRDNRLPKEAMHKCVKEHGKEEHADLVQKCYDSLYGRELLKLNGDATHALRPAVSFIPTITLDGSQGRQAAILKDLLAEVCKIIGDTEQANKICKID